MVWNDALRLMAMMASHFSGGKLLDPRHVLDAGVVDQDVDAAQRRLVSATRSAISAGLLMSAP